jgi:MFS family permease
MAIETAESNIFSTQALGYYHTIIVISIISAPTVSGFLFEYNGNYIMAYNISAICSFIGAFILLFYKDLFFYKLFSYLKKKNKETISSF